MTDVIVLGFNRPVETYETIKALTETNDVSVILIHNGSTDKPDLSDINGSIVEVMLEKNVGLARAVNLGLDMVDSEYVCVMHNDIVIRDNGWILKAVNFLKSNPKAGLVCVLGWNYPEGKKKAVTAVKHKGWKPLEKDFIEVQRTDNIVNIFKNDGIRADERYGYSGISLYMDILSKGLKLYVMNFKDIYHYKTHTFGDGKHDVDIKKEIEHSILVHELRKKEFGIEY